MPEKLKFKPIITRIKLNPEQAVLACTCWDARRTFSSARTAGTTCSGGRRVKVGYRVAVTSGAIS